MRYNKLLIAFLLIAALALILISCSVVEDDTVYAIVSRDNASGDFYYDLYENGDAVITGARATQKRLTIPDKLDGHKVTGIGEGAFAEDNNLVYLVIGANVKTIGAEAFRDCLRLVAVELGAAVRSIGDEAFMNCELLSDISGGPSLEKIGEYAFNACISLPKMDFPESLRSIGDAAFEGCSALCELILPEKFERIGINSFASCDALCRVSLGSVSDIPDGAFEKCVSLTKIELGRQVTAIGERSFRGCSKLSSVSIERSVETIGNSAFSETLWLENNTSEFVIVGNGVLIKYNGSTANLVLPKEVRRISDAFSGNETLRSLNAKGVISVGESAFSGCVNLASVTFGEGLETIASRAFSSCSGLSTVYLPKSLKTVEKNAFYKCDALTAANYAGSSKNWSSVSVSKTGNISLTAVLNYGVKP